MDKYDNEYFQKMINAQFDHIRADIKDLKEDTSKILTQTSITNGRVTVLERWQSEVNGANIATDKGRSKTDWWLVFVVSTLFSVGTIIATKLWH